LLEKNVQLVDIQALLGHEIIAQVKKAVVRPLLKAVDRMPWKSETLLPIVFHKLKNGGD
jgi:hypothetical protein